jgi:putative two-component system response regulator
LEIKPNTGEAVPSILESNSVTDAAPRHDDVDYYEAYRRELDKNRLHEQELSFLRVELEKFKNEAAKAYILSKERHKDSALMSAQAVKTINDLHKKLKELDGAKKNLRDAYKDTINRLAVASEYKDNETGNHILRMSRYSVYLAGLYGQTPEQLEEMEFTSPMHDVGKIGIKDNILFKNGKLTDAEFNEMKKHTTIGAAILNNPKSPIIECARQIALFHHEKWNGRGYPHGIKGEDIPINARIVAICDTFDALTSKRPYKMPYPIDVSCDIIGKGRGEDFDPDLVDLFLKNIEGFVKIKDNVDEENDDEDIVRANFSWSERDKETGKA